ncbi:hypothetical protein NA56DRAFT_701671 [Hyaloscypha hepaticicola]|uniref:Uncharacterized protein n=1 Tax=Hyaloscypha hepaticicola TaxID=2082293 RepID=A0A2J6QAW0_9HELO|nr:hypothetical protein NA56DRAFT_701671 [Hyaloscypha hepaticicola]
MPPAVDELDIGPHDPQYKSNPEEQTRETNQHTSATQDARQQARPGSMHIPFLDRLRALPEVRLIPWRPGQELPPEKSIDSPRVQQRGAVLLSTRGGEAPSPCSHCAAGYGRFSKCIILEQWFQGACSGCIFTSKGNKCSLRFQTSGIADGRALRYVEDPEILKSYIRNAAENPKPPKKRKRRSAPSQMQSAAEPSHTSSCPDVTTPQVISPGTDLDTILQAEIAREQSSGYHDVIHIENKRLKPHNPSQPNVARARGPLIGTASSLYPDEPRKVIPDASSTRNPAHIPTERHWPVQHPLAEGKKSVTPGYATMQDTSEYPKTTTTPMIDTLPKAKQRQIYSVISGLQGSIDHLKKQLDSLKAVLGIDDEDPTEPR